VSRSGGKQDDHGQVRRGESVPGRPASDAALVLGLGADLCAVHRLRRELARDGQDAVEAIFRASERAWCERHRDPARAYAACFAAKEAVIKALARSGGRGTFWQDIEIGDDGHGRPAVTLHGRIADLAHDLGVRRIRLSHAHSQDYATACAIVSGRPAAPGPARPHP
jgi:holo-[acyl-carrier protein] synthase